MHVIFGRERQRASKGRKVAGWSATLQMTSNWAFDLDVRPLVEWVTVNLAWHFRRQIEDGEQPAGGAKAPNVTAWTKVVSGKNRARDTVMVRTGFGVDRWWLGEIRGDEHSARRTIKPYGGSDGPKPPKGGAGRDLLWNVLLKRGYDPQSVQGSAKAMIANTLADWMTTTVGIHPGIDVRSVGKALLKDVEGD